MKSLVCVFAHPDDESFGPGGTIAKYARERDVYIICVTNGNAGENATHKADLGKVRRAELLESAEILGVKGVEFLDYDDGSLCNNLYHEIADKIENLFNKYKPDTILTFENKGVSGHLDHIMVSLVTTYVYKKVDFVYTLLYFCEPKERTAELDNYFIYVPPGYPEGEVDLVVDIEDVWETKMAAMKVHRSQQHDVDMMLEVFEKYPKQDYFLVLKK